MFFCNCGRQLSFLPAITNVKHLTIKNVCHTLGSGHTSHIEGGSADCVTNRIVFTREQEHIKKLVL